jgi:hypothetical protein
MPADQAQYLKSEVRQSLRREGGIVDDERGLLAGVFGGGMRWHEPAT